MGCSLPSPGTVPLLLEANHSEPEQWPTPSVHLAHLAGTWQYGQHFLLIAEVHLKCRQPCVGVPW